MMNKAKTLVVSALLGAVVVGANASATTDFSTILTGLDSTTAVTAIIGAGVILAGVGFAKWATKKVARFFG